MEEVFIVHREMDSEDFERRGFTIIGVYKTREAAEKALAAEKQRILKDEEWAKTGDVVYNEPGLYEVCESNGCESITACIEKRKVQ